MQCRQGDVVLHGQQTDDADREEGGGGRDIDAHAQIGQSPIAEAAQHTCHRINLLTEDDRLLVEQHITDYTAEGTRDAAHDDGHPERETAIEGFLDSGDIEQCQAEGIEKKPRVVETLEIMVANDDHQLRKQRTQKVDGAEHPERMLAEHHIADGSAADGHSHATHKAAQPVVMLGGGKSDARKGKCKGSNELDDALQRQYEFRVLMNSHFFFLVLDYS